MVHPAPRITSAPSPKRLIYVKGVVYGACRAYEAIVIDQAEEYDLYKALVRQG